MADKTDKPKSQTKPDKPALKENALSKIVLLDTCIIQYLNHSKMGHEIIEYLEEISKQGYILSISQITCFELLKNLTQAKQAELMRTLSVFSRYHVSEQVLVVAAELSTLYKEQSNFESKPDSTASNEDKIIASTSVVIGTKILTANLSDFPRPFFREVEEKEIIYKHKSGSQMITIQLLEPNFPIIQQKADLRK